MNNFKWKIFFVCLAMINGLIALYCVFESFHLFFAILNSCNAFAAMIATQVVEQEERKEK